MKNKYEEDRSKLASVFRAHIQERLYVAALPGDGGTDWGYSSDPTKAIYLNFYWQRRFAENCRLTNGAASFFVSWSGSGSWY